MNKIFQTRGAIHCSICIALFFSSVLCMQKDGYTQLSKDLAALTKHERKEIILLPEEEREALVILYHMSRGRIGKKDKNHLIKKSKKIKKRKKPKKRKIRYHCNFVFPDGTQCKKSYKYEGYFKKHLFNVHGYAK
ncbi:hypothetical protein ACFLYA_00155 [Candidatus Dependentiae bacterium]